MILFPGIMIISFDDEQQTAMLYRVEPSGYYAGFKAVASGVKQIEATTFLEKNFKKRSNKVPENLEETIEVSPKADIVTFGMWQHYCSLWNILH